MGFPRQEYWSGLPFPPLRESPAPDITPAPFALAGGFFTIEPSGKPSVWAEDHLTRTGPLLWSLVSVWVPWYHASPQTPHPIYQEVLLVPISKCLQNPVLCCSLQGFHPGLRHRPVARFTDCFLTVLPASTTTPPPQSLLFSTQHPEDPSKTSDHTLLSSNLPTAPHPTPRKAPSLYHAPQELVPSPLLSSLTSCLMTCSLAPITIVYTRHETCMVFVFLSPPWLCSTICTDQLCSHPNKAFTAPMPLPAMLFPKMPTRSLPHLLHVFFAQMSLSKWTLADHPI